MSYFVRNWRRTALLAFGFVLMLQLLLPKQVLGQADKEQSSLVSKTRPERSFPTQTVIVTDTDGLALRVQTGGSGLFVAAAVMIVGLQHSLKALRRSRGLVVADLLRPK